MSFFPLETVGIRSKAPTNSIVSLLEPGGVKGVPRRYKLEKKEFIQSGKVLTYFICDHIIKYGRA